jgi:hypothetical protein
LIFYNNGPKKQNRFCDNFPLTGKKIVIGLPFVVAGIAVAYSNTLRRFISTANVRRPHTKVVTESREMRDESAVADFRSLPLQSRGVTVGKQNETGKVYTENPKLFFTPQNGR